MNSFKSRLSPTAITWRGLVAGLLLAFSINSSFGQSDFGAYYTRIHTGQDWEKFSRSGEYADIIVQLAQPQGQLVFWRGNSYLPYWKTEGGQWDLSQLVPRSGDGTAAMPDRVNIYSHVEIIENTTSNATVHWRYLSMFSAGNPHGKVDPNNFVEELFRIMPDGTITRIVKQGTEKIDGWNDPLNQTTQVLQVGADGVRELSRKGPGRSPEAAAIAGNPEKGPAIITPSAWFKFDEGQGDITKENLFKVEIAVPGHKTLWKKGVSGTALEFDGYHTSVSLPAAKAPAVNGGDLTLEGWFAMGAYPWNWAPIVQQGDDDGYFLGVDSHGYPGFMAKVNGTWHQLVVPGKPPYRDTNHFELFKWYHVAGTYSKTDGMMRLYVNGREIARAFAGMGGVQTVNADVRVGKSGVLREPTEGTNTNLKSEYGFDGLIDEVRIYTVALSVTQVAESYQKFNPGAEIVNAPDLQKRLFPNPNIGKQFRAIYTHLPYYETWENLWRFGQHPDVVVGFDQLPIKYVFWRGVSYIPMLVNETNQWYCNEFCETGFTEKAPGDCEPMSDKGCWDSHVRIIENTPARAVVHWRYRLSNPSHQWANYNAATGWGDIADWYYYIYPDGVASKLMRCYTSEPDVWHEWDEQIAVLSEGQHPESVIEKTPVMTLVDGSGKAFDYDWVLDPPKPDYKNKIIQVIHLTGQYDPFTIQKFDDGDIYSGERIWYSVTPSWNHWPSAQVNSSGRNSSFSDRAAHSSISHLFWPYSQRQRGDAPFDEKTLMEGMTDQSAASLTSLAKSWLQAPGVSEISGGTSRGYSQAQRAYEFTRREEKLSFRIDASEGSPIRNLCLVVQNWGGRATVANLSLNGVSQAAGPNFRQGIIIDTDGTYTLVIWLGMNSATPQNIAIQPNR